MSFNVTHSVVVLAILVATIIGCVVKGNSMKEILESLQYVDSDCVIGLDEYVM